MIHMRTNIINIFFVFLAAVVFNAHMILPHDHHLTQSDHCQTTLPFHHDSSHHTGFPVHCHAFNDLTPEEAIINSSVNLFQSIQFITLPDEKVTEHALLFLRISFFENSKKLVTISPSESFSLRAPPTLI